MKYRRLMKLCLIYILLLPLASAQDTQRVFRPPDGASVAINPINVDASEYLDRIMLPPGFEISLYVNNIEGPRSMSLAPDGTLYVSTRFNRNRETIGKVYAVVDKDGDYRADEVITVAEGLNIPNGVAYHEGNLYVAELNRVIRYDDIEGRKNNRHDPVVIDGNFPSDVMHGWKFIRFGPDNKLYVPVGAPCNICEPPDTHASLFRMNADGSGREVYARGIRNTVGFDWHPSTGKLWFTDNGRDLWGDDRPPEEINHAPVAGLHFGFPYRFGKDLVDTTYQTTMTDQDFTPAAYEMPAHTAGLGMDFYTGSSFPEKYKNQMIVVYHGSWNRSKPSGYSVAVIKLDGNKVVGHEYLATGWLVDEKFWGRPVDVEVMADGSVLISDDHANCIYRIRYKG